MTLGPTFDAIAWGVGAATLAAIALCLAWLLLHAVRTAIFVGRILANFTPPAPRPRHEWIVAPFVLFYEFFFDPNDRVRLRDGKLIYWPGKAKLHRTKDEY